jgi:regulator of protease activity HflC (stomatin/prohibitin superfamily)
MGFSMMFVVPIVVVVAFAVITATVKILRQYERAVVFTLGRFEGVKGPGLVLLIPFFQEMVRVDYHRGSWGPKDVDAIIAADGGWHNPGSKG